MSPAVVNLLQGLAGALFFAAAGLTLTSSVPTLRDRGLWVRLAWSYLFGLALVGAALWASSHLFGLPLRRGMILPLWGALSIAGLATAMRHLRRRATAPSSAAAPPLAPVKALATAVVLVGVLVTTALLAQSATQPGRDIDGRMTWVAHARYLRQAATVSPPALAEERWLVSHPQYPKLLPLAQVAQLELWGSADERSMRALYALFFPVLLLLVYDGGRRLAGHVPGLLAAGSVATLPAAAFQYDGGAAGAYSDLPLACLWGGGLLLLACGPRDGRTAVAAGILLAGGVLTKAEGLPLALLALAAVALRPLCPRRGPDGRPGGWQRVWERLRLPSMAALPVLGAWGLLASWQAGIPRRYTEDHLGRLRLEPLLQGLGRLGEIGAEIAARTLDPSSWQLHWALFPLLLAVGWRGWAHRQSLARSSPLLLAVAGAVGIYLLAYLISPWGEHLVDLVRLTWPRFLVQLLVPLHLLLALALGALIGAQRPGGAPRR